jgi:phosphomannomutase
MSQIKFGTDGWRAVIAEDFTFAAVEQVTQATAAEWMACLVANAKVSGTGALACPSSPGAPARKDRTGGGARSTHTGEGACATSLPAGTKSLVVVGYDRRFLSDQFAARVAEVFAGNGFTVLLSDSPVPTPAVSYAVKANRAAGGVMITASHNPPRFNGYKIKAWFGGAADPVLCQAVEQRLGASPVQSRPLAEAVKAKQILVKDLRRPHYEAIKRLVDFKLIAGSKLRFAHEALFGVGAGCFDELLAGTTCRVTTLNAAHDVNFGGINPEPLAKNYVRSAAYLKKHPHDLCLVTDGDADRVGGMDGHGNALSTHQIICLLLHHYVVNRKMTGRVVKALTTTSMVDKLCAKHGLPLTETGVGFKFISSELLKGDVLLGAEESGGIGFPGHIPERDGILAGLVLLEMLAMERKPLLTLLAGLEKEFGPHRYGRIDTSFPLEKRAPLMAYCAANPPAKLLKSPVVDVKTYDGVKFIAEDGSWLMLRGSGTEPILRIYAETRTDDGVRTLLKQGVALTKKV